MTSSQVPSDFPPDQPGAVPARAADQRAPSATTLIQSLDDPDWRIRQAAALKLGETADPAATRLVLEAMQSQHKNLRVLNAAIRAVVQNGVDVVIPLAKFLKDPDAQLRIAVALVLGERRDPRAIPFVRQALADPDSNVRYHAVEALGKLQAGEAVDDLVAIARSGEFHLAAPALDALATIGDCRVASELTSLLSDELLQFSALEALGSLGSVETATLLVGLLNTNNLLRAAAAGALVGIWRRYERSYHRGDLIVKVVAEGLSPGGLTSLRELAAESRGPESSALAVILGWAPDVIVEPTLVSLLDRPAARQSAIAALLCHGPQIADPVAGCLSSADPDTKAAALQILGRVGSRHQIPAIVATADSDPELAVAVVETLVAMGDAPAFEALIPFLRNRESPVRQAAVAAIASMKPLAASLPWQRLLVDENPAVREATVRIIAGSKLVRTDLLLESCRDPDESVRCAAFEALGHAGDLRVLPFLSDSLQSGRGMCRAAAVQALGSLPDPSVGPLLRTALNDSDPWVRYFAARSLGEQSDPLAIDALLQIAELDVAVPVRAAAVDALSQLHAERAVPLFMRLAREADQDLKLAALAALGSVDRPDAAAVLVEAASATERSTQLAAIQALGASSVSIAVETLRRIATDDSDAVAVKAAIDALECSPAAHAAPALLLLTRYPACRELCVGALSRLDASHLDSMAVGLEHELLDVRRATVEVLSRHADRRALTLLAAALCDPHPAVRQAAEARFAVSQIPLSRETES